MVKKKKKKSSAKLSPPGQRPAEGVRRGICPPLLGDYYITYDKMISGGYLL